MPPKYKNARIQNAMIKNYEAYLEHITNKINEFFDKQKPYIFCKKGCSLCCEKGEYPWSFIEYKYLMIGFNVLPFETKKIIEEKIKKIKEEKKNFKGEGTFFYDCPFLINKECAVYKYRGIICRSFGLLHVSEKNGKIQMPFCHKLGLNYSNVYDKEKNTVSTEMYEKLGVDIPPKCFNVGYNF